MRVVVLAVALLLGCQKPIAGKPPLIEIPLLRTVAVGAPSAASQLLGGFYAIEDSWRWAGPSFSVKLRTPGNADFIAPKLFVDGYLPDSLFRHHPQTTLHCRVGDLDVPAVVFQRAGPAHLEHQLPPLTSPTSVVNCTIQPTLPPSATDIRELGMVVHSVGLRAP